MSSQQQKFKILRELLNSLKKNEQTLKHSLNQCEPLKNKSEYNIEDLDKLEALTSRFSRVSDIIIQKVFRSIDDIELVDEGSLLDRISRASKRRTIVKIS